MSSQSFHSLITIILLCFNFISLFGVSTCYKNYDDHESTFGGFGTGFRRPYGPQLEHKNCRLKCKNLIQNAEAMKKEIEECTALPISCKHAKYSKYRTIDGSCNNLKHPSWGMSNTCQKRILYFDYEDNISKPRISCTGNNLPNARLISNVFHRERIPKHDIYTTHFMEWGQMVSHDLSLNDIFKTPESGFNLAIECCTNGPVTDDRCMSVAVPPSDPFYPQFNVTCVDIARTLPCRLCKGGKRMQSNQNTAYHDLSPIYASERDRALALRSKTEGMFELEGNGKYSPLLTKTRIQERCESPNGTKECYFAGDDRINQNPFLLTIHIYLALFHNFICKHLARINPHWNDEKLYQEGRRINIAISQYITYGEYLPIILGENAMREEGLHVLHGGQYTKYNRHLDASVLSEYSAAAGRYGHTQIPGPFSNIDPGTCKRETIFLRDYFHRPFEFGHGQYDKVALGMTKDRLMRRDAALSDDVRNHLYQRTYRNETLGIDLAAVSIQRGRDHGIGGYTCYLQYFLNIAVHEFDDLSVVLPKEAVHKLKTLYESPHDVDLYSAGLAEKNIPGALVGPVFKNILVEQYIRTKFGDRYWFEHGHEAGSFTPQQLEEIKRTTLSFILCATTEIDSIQRNVFLPPCEKTNPTVSCDDIHKFNFYLWKE